MTFYVEPGYSDRAATWPSTGRPRDCRVYPLNLRMVVRSNVAPLYRSDVT